MIVKEDDIVRCILKEIGISKEPLETKEVEILVKKSIKTATRIKVVYRLNNLRGEGLIKGKYLGSGKGVWIWWSASAFSLGVKSGADGNHEEVVRHAPQHEFKRKFSHK